MNGAVPKRAVVLFAHGSRDPLWRKPMEAVAERISVTEPGVAVACAYLELCTPSLSEAVQTLVTSGITHVTVVPMFLGVGKHAREDLPLLMEELRQQNTAVQFALQRAVGEDSRLLDVLAAIALEPSST